MRACARMHAWLCVSLAVRTRACLVCVALCVRAVYRNIYIHMCRYLYTHACIYISIYKRLACRSDRLCGACLLACLSSADPLACASCASAAAQPMPPDGAQPEPSRSLSEYPSSTPPVPLQYPSSTPPVPLQYTHSTPRLPSVPRRRHSPTPSSQYPCTSHSAQS
jgi:hypothetical protein